MGKVDIVKRKRRCKSATAASRFWTKVAKGTDEECWNWIACTQLFGYGILRGDDGRATRAHRFSWKLHNGPIPDSMCVCHHCDNPRCVNPAHLFLGTHNDNRQDCVRKGRGSYGIGRAKLGLDDVKQIKSELRRGVMGIDLAKRFNISTQSVSSINCGHVWPSVEA